jgi:membrane protein required for colicin V production
MTSLAFNWLDWVLIGIIATSTLVGLFRGFVREGLSIVVWILAFYLAFILSPALEEKVLAEYISHPTIRYSIAFASILVLTLIIGSFANYLIATAVKKTGLGGTDGLLGTVFGFVRGVLIIAVILLFAKLTPIVDQEWFKESKVLPKFAWLEEWIHRVMPKEVQQYLQPRDIKSNEEIFEEEVINLPDDLELLNDDKQPQQDKAGSDDEITIYDEASSEKMITTESDSDAENTNWQL